MEARNPDMGWGWGSEWGLGICPMLEDGRETVLVIWSKVGLWRPQGRDEYPACGYPEATDISYAVPKPWVRSYLNDQLVSSVNRGRAVVPLHVRVKAVATMRRATKTPSNRVMTLRADTLLHTSPLPRCGGPTGNCFPVTWGFL